MMRLGVTPTRCEGSAALSIGMAMCGIEVTSVMARETASRMVPLGMAMCGIEVTSVMARETVSRMVPLGMAMCRIEVTSVMARETASRISVITWIEAWHRDGRPVQGTVAESPCKRGPNPDQPHAAHRRDILGRIPLHRRTVRD